MEASSPPLPRWTRLLPAAVLLLVAITYLPSLGGGWVWDDHYLLEANPALKDVGWLLSTDIWSPTGTGASDLYRPLVMLSHVPEQAAWPGPLSARLVNLLLHLLATIGVAQLAARAGANSAAAWIGAAAFALHPAAVEAVAWVTGRHDLLPSVLMLLGWWGICAGRGTWAGLSLAAAPFCKEPYILATVTVLVWGVAERRALWSTLLLSAAGGAGYLAARWSLDRPVQSLGLDLAEVPGALGAVALRLVELCVVPGSADPFDLLRPAPALGYIAGVLGLLSGVWLWRSRSRAAAVWVSALGLLAPAALAALVTGVLSDRYFYLSFAALGVVFAVALSRAVHKHRAAWALAALPLLLAPGSALRAMDWRSDLSVFSRSLERAPNNPHAAFRMGYLYHIRQSSCADALPFYRVAWPTVARAGNNLQACLIGMGELDDAIAMGPTLVKASPSNATPAVNTARALAQAGDLDAALRYIDEALSREPASVSALLLQGNLLGMKGDFEGALTAFERALAVAPGNVPAQQGAALARQKHAEAQGQPER